MKNTLQLGLFSSLLTLGTGCIAVEVDVPEVCVTQKGITMFAAPPGASADFKAQIEKSFPVDGLGIFTSIAEAVQADAVADLHSITLYAPEEMPSISFVDEAYARIDTPNVGSLPPIELGCPVGECNPIGRELRLSPATITSIMDYVAADSLQLSVKLAGALPTSDWKLDVDVCMSTSVSVKRDL